MKDAEASLLDFGFDTPVPPDIRQRRVLIKLARIPSAHLVVAFELGVLDFLLGEELGGFLH